MNVIADELAELKKEHANIKKEIENEARSWNVDRADLIALHNKEDILKKNLSELNYSLVIVDKLIEKNIPGCRHFLLERKKLILDRIQELSSNEKIGNLQELVDQLSGGEIKDKLLSELTVLREDAAKYNQEMKKIATTEAAIKLEQHRIDGLERKSKIWLSFLQRESAASIIGGIVLLMLTVALISGMIFGRESQILSNGFLVILGYFFGQSSSKNNQDRE
jgi:hypothetical protein